MNAYRVSTVRIAKEKSSKTINRKFTMSHFTNVEEVCFYN